MEEIKEVLLEEVSGGAKQGVEVGKIEIGNIKHRISIRRTKSGQGEAIGYAHLGDVLPYFGKEGHWYVVYCKGVRGYIHDSHVVRVIQKTGD